jgi:hypothetical protein
MVPLALYSEILQDIAITYCTHPVKFNHTLEMCYPSSYVIPASYLCLRWNSMVRPLSLLFRNPKVLCSNLRS